MFSELAPALQELPNLLRRLDADKAPNPSVAVDIDIIGGADLIGFLVFRQVET